jgi:hypothetical protein
MAVAGALASASETASAPAIDSALTTCSYSLRSSCSSAGGGKGSDTLTWGGCSLGATATLYGGWVDVWSALANCNTNSLATNGDTLTRTTPVGQILRFYTGAKIITTSEAHTAYDGTSITGAGALITLTDSSVNTRTIVINGFHRKFYGPYGGQWFDQSVLSPVASDPNVLTVTGKRSTTNRVVTGHMTIYHNLSSYTAVHAFSSVTWGSSTCCYPTSGHITTTLSGSLTGTRTINFAKGATTCGLATFTDTDNTSKDITLTMCE